jgi:arylsulfatase A-like enzyme
MKRSITLLFAVLIQALIGSMANAKSKPNLVIFLSDDHTRKDSTVYGATDLKTPNMDRLAADGLTFDRAFVASPSCAPSRAVLLTGLMPARNGAEPNHSKPRAEIKKLPAYLQELGYEVVAFGKVSHYKQTIDYGFDYFAHDAFHEDIAVEAAVDWLNKRKSDKPLCLFVGSNWPHVPWPKDPGDNDPARIEVPANHVDTPLTRKWRARYYAAITKMDNDLGMVYDAARKKFGDNIMFLHTSDHGAQWPFSKWTLYDDGIRTPMIAVWPGKISPDTRTPAMVSWVDILPTLVDIAGGTPPKDLDGSSFRKVLLGETAKHRDLIFTTHSGDGNHNVYPSRSVRDESWKYILNLHPEFKFSSHTTDATNDDPYWKSWVRAAKSHPDAAEKVRRYQVRPKEELYDLQNDPLEQKNLASDPDQAARLEKMRKEVQDWMKEQGDKKTIYGKPRLLSDAQGKR